MTQHTPGPWEVGKGVTPAVTLVDSPYDIESENRANAYLMAASPELLAALKELVNWWEIDGGNLDRSLATAVAAIARAEGRTP